MRLFAVLISLVGMSAIVAGEPGITGNWTVTLLEPGQQTQGWLLRVASKDGKLVATADRLQARFLQAKVSDVAVTGDRLSFIFRLGEQVLTFEGRLPKAEGKRILGTFLQGDQVLAVSLDRTPAGTPFEFYREALRRREIGPAALAALPELIAKAEAQKVAPREIEDWVTAALDAAARFGARLQVDVALQLTDALIKEKRLTSLAVQAARTGAEALGKGADAELQLRALNNLATALRKTGKTEQASAVEARMAKLEADAYREYRKKALPYKPERFAGRRGDSKRAVLVELFTGAQCPPCIATDLAFDGLVETYRPSEVVLLQYHVHVPGPDALSNPATEARMKYYDDRVPGTPTVLVNGELAPIEGGFHEDAAQRYKEARALLDKFLEKPTPVEMQAKAVRKGDKVHIQAKASGIPKPGKNIRLRLALVQDWARYRGANGLVYHHRVVRDMPGGAEGLALTEREGTQEVTVDLSELRERLAKYLDDFAANEAPFPDAQRPLGLRDLRVVAFVQNDETKEVLQAVEVPVADEER